MALINPIIDYRPMHVPLRFCEHCNNPLTFQKDDYPKLYRQKQYCGFRCRNIVLGIKRAKDRSMPDLLLFWGKILGEFPDGCWLWQGGDKDKDGYGLFRPYGKRGKHYRAHRFSYEYFRGSIPGDLPLDHLCDMPSCVHPYHLEAKTQRENVLRGRGLSAQNARKTHCKHGHSFSEENTCYGKGHYGIQRICRACKRQDAFLRRQAKKIEQ